MTPPELHRAEAISGTQEQEIAGLQAKNEMQLSKLLDQERQQFTEWTKKWAKEQASAEADAQHVEKKLRGRRQQEQTVSNEELEAQQSALQRQVAQLHEQEVADRRKVQELESA